MLLIISQGIALLIRRRAGPGEQSADAGRTVWTGADVGAIVAAPTVAPDHGRLRLQYDSRLKRMDVGTLLFTWLNGKKVGSDSYGNRYYRSRRRPRYGRERRWVMFNGAPEASKIPPEWHAWLHHVTEEPLPEAAKTYPWAKPHLPNLSGTPFAYRPKGHDLRGGKRQRTTGDYEPWTPS